MPDLLPRPLRSTTKDLALFVNRSTEARIATQTLTHGGNVLAVGKRGSGKSSFLSYVTARLRDDGFDVARVDGRVASSAQEFLALLEDELRTPGPPTSSFAPSWLREASVGAPRVGPQLLLDRLASLHQRLAGRDERAIAVVDEFSSPEIGQLLFGRLRDELWELPISWLVAADERDRGSFTSRPADAFWTRIITIGALSQEDLRELLRRRLGDETLASSVEAQLVEEGNGNPRRLLNLAYDVIVEGHSPATVLEHRKKRAGLAKKLSEPAQDLLAELEANGPAGPSDRAILEAFGWSRGRASQVFSELEKAGLVRSTTRPAPTGRPRRVFELAE